MKRYIILLFVISALSTPVSAMDFTAPEAPSNAQQIMPDDTESFGEGLRYIFLSAMDIIQPSITQALGICVSVISISIICGTLDVFSGNTIHAIQVAGTAATGLVLFKPVNALIYLGTDTVEQISHYGKLLLPVMTGALAAQGGITKSGALYTATAFFDAVLSVAISELLVPIIYVFLCVAIACNIYSEPLLKNIKEFIKWFLTWGLKTILYVFTGYISVTGIVGGTTDATVLKATKLTISGAVPVVGNILSDASEAVLASATVMRNSAGIYGLLTVIALVISPFVQIGVQYLMLKMTAGLCETIGSKEMASLVKDFSSAMGLILAMSCTVCVIFLISTICFMKGVS